MMKRIFLALTLGALTVGSAATAQKPVNLKQANQERRIDAGVRSGKLSPGEAAGLKAQQHSIASDEMRLKARHGGHLTAYDKRIIHARQARANRAILAKKHNRLRGRNHLKVKI